MIGNHLLYDIFGWRALRLFFAVLFVFGAFCKSSDDGWLSWIFAYCCIFWRPLSIFSRVMDTQMSVQVCRCVSFTGTTLLQSLQMAALTSRSLFYRVWLEPGHKTMFLFISRPHRVSGVKEILIWCVCIEAVLSICRYPKPMHQICVGYENNGIGAIQLQWVHVWIQTSTLWTRGRSPRRSLLSRQVWEAEGPRGFFWIQMFEHYKQETTTVYSVIAAACSHHFNLVSWCG